MTRTEHYAEAERLIASTRSWHDKMFSPARMRTGNTPMIMSVDIDYVLRLAQIHATLATAPSYPREAANRRKS